MADFCKQCSIELFGEDYGDMKYERKDKDGTVLTLSEGEGWAELCEGCGPTLTLDDGTCITHTDEEHKALYRTTYADEESA